MDMPLSPQGRIIIFLSIGILLLVSCTGEQSADERDQPNIIYILADDLGYNEIGAYGQQKIETPNIDALAESGMTFTQHYTGSPVCAPARYILMTGKHSGNAYIRGNDEWSERGDVWDIEAMHNNPVLEGQRPIPDSTFTVAELLQEVGYRTGIVGKWGLGGPGSKGHPNEQGFDFFYGYIGQRQAHNYYPHHLWKNRGRDYLDNELQHPHTPLPDSLDPYDESSYAKFQDQPDYAPDLMMDELLAFMDRQQDVPFFLHYATPLPHLSLQAPERWVDYYVDKFGEEEPYTGDEGYLPVRYPKATYAAMISYLDEQVGKLIDKLKEADEYQNTLIIFTSDNGPAFNAGVDPEFFESARPFNGTYGWGKGFLHEGGIRVPMIASWPGNIESGQRTDHISAFWDVMPTLADIAGADKPDNIDGVSFAPLLLGNEEEQETHDYLYWEFPQYGGQQAVRLGKWKGIRKNIKEEGNLQIELYNLNADIREENNVADKHPEIVERIRNIMKREHTEPALDAFRMKALDEK